MQLSILVIYIVAVLVLYISPHFAYIVPEYSRIRDDHASWPVSARKPVGPKLAHTELFYRSKTNPVLDLLLRYDEEIREKTFDKLERIHYHINKRRRYQWRKPWFIRKYPQRHRRRTGANRLLMARIQKEMDSMPDTGSVKGKVVEWNRKPRWPRAYLCYSKQKADRHADRERLFPYHMQWHRRNHLNATAQAGPDWQIRLSGFESFKPEAHFTAMGGFTHRDVREMYAAEPMTAEGVVEPPMFFTLKERDRETERWTSQPVSPIVMFALFNSSTDWQAFERKHERYHRRANQMARYYELYAIPSDEYEELTLSDVDPAYLAINYTVPPQAKIEDPLIRKYWELETMDQYMAVRSPYHPNKVPISDSLRKNYTASYRNGSLLSTSLTPHPLLAPPKQVGVMMIFNADTHAQAMQYINKDPFMINHVYDNSSIHIGDCEWYDLTGLGNATASNAPVHKLLEIELPPLDSLPDHHERNREVVEKYIQFIRRVQWITKPFQNIWKYKEWKIPFVVSPRPDRFVPVRGSRMTLQTYDDLETLIKRANIPNYRPLKINVAKLGFDY